MLQKKLKTLFEQLPPKRVVILGYHRVRERGGDGCDSIDTLKMHVETLGELGYRFATLRQLAEECFRPPRRTAVLTFDDGYQDFYAIAAPLLLKYHIRATVFVVSGYVDTGKVFSWISPVSIPLDLVMTSEQIRHLYSEGFEIGAHTVNHVELTTLSTDSAGKEIRGSKDDIEQLLGAPVVSFCYPRGCYNPEVMKLVRDAGFRAAVVSRFSSCVRHPWVPRNTPWDLARIYPYSNLQGFRRQLSVGYEVMQYVSHTLRILRKR